MSPEQVAAAFGGQPQAAPNLRMQSYQTSRDNAKAANIGRSLITSSPNYLEAAKLNALRQTPAHQAQMQQIRGGYGYVARR